MTKIRKRFIPPKKDHKYITINGITFNKKPVIGNVFKVIDGVGIHINDLLYALKEKEAVIDWYEFIDDCFEHNWNPDRLLTRLEDALVDVYGREETDNIMFGIKLI